MIDPATITATATAIAAVIFNKAIAKRSISNYQKTALYLFFKFTPS